ncbi:uncharacterized protein LOC112688982 isoform X2 [Sipha flava]|uniref:Uncharacterized protein LOC112688982 isoform X2 n=1 Tax=Sipha flava TaxID=143950 RepID=A0A2S2PXC3_9HEMI|nr:uncharacterized protein LOC112688982 isoform X2 [Sipha flava]
MYVKSVFAWCFLLSCSPSSSGLEWDDVNDIFGMTKNVVEYVSKSWDIVDKVPEHVGSENTPLIWFTKKRERSILTNFGRITQIVRSMQKETDDIRSIMLSNLNKLQSMSDVVLNGIQINELLESVRSIENDFKTMEEYKYGENDSNEKSRNTYSSYTLERFADAMLSFTSGAPIKQMAKIHTFIIPDLEGFKFHTHGGIFNILKDTMEGPGMLCDQKQSLQQMVFNLYGTLHLTQLKGFSVMQFSWMLLQTYGKGNFTYERTNQMIQFEKRIEEQLNALKYTMSSSSNIFWRCDPEKHIKDKTYLEVTELLQGYIENEADMNYEHSCMQNCEYYSVAEHKSCFNDQFCAKQHVCNGRILNCQYIDSDMRICQSKFGSSRRYDYIAYEKGRTLGDSSDCKGTMSNVDSWWTFLVLHCSYCFCICDSNEPSSDRHFSLRPSLSNIDQNKVVTGLRFIKIKQMFHLQVQEGDLGPRATINEDSRQWVELPGTSFTFRNKTLKNGVDYHTLSYASRSIDLDNVMAPEKMVITGVKFRLIGSHLNLEVRVTPFDFMTGKLIEPQNKSYWIGNENTELTDGSPRSEIYLNDLDLPTKASISSEPDMSSNKFLKFTHSSIDRDVAQSTIPFIDKQTVDPYPGVPLSGVGIYYKGVKSYGGFIGANVFTYDFSKDLNIKLFSIHGV